jgi:hypothetical protein
MRDCYILIYAWINQMVPTGVCGNWNFLLPASMVRADKRPSLHCRVEPTLLCFDNILFLLLPWRDCSPRQVSKLYC